MLLIEIFLLQIENNRYQRVVINLQ